MQPIHSPPVTCHSPQPPPLNTSKGLGKSSVTSASGSGSNSGSPRGIDMPMQRISSSTVPLASLNRTNEFTFEAAAAAAALADRSTPRRSDASSATDVSSAETRGGSEQLRQLPPSVRTEGRAGQGAPAAHSSPKPRIVHASPRSTEPVPKKELRWKQGGLLGKGAFGEVWVGLNTGTGELMAVKHLVFDITMPDVQKRLQQLQFEVKIMRQVQHTNIVRYISAQRSGSGFNIFMEFVAGGSIASLLSQFGPLSDAVVATYTSQIATALNHLHKNNIVHQDVKGANVLVDVNGICKVCDFGTAEYIQKAGTAAGMSGTPFWMAPEVIKPLPGQGRGTPCDIWSLGCTMIEMMTAQHPFAHVVSTPLEAMQFIANEKCIATRLPETVLAKPAPVRELLIECLQKQPERRPPAAKVLHNPYLMQHDCGTEVTDSEETYSIETETYATHSAYNATTPRTLKGGTVVTASQPDIERLSIGSLMPSVPPRPTPSAPHLSPRSLGGRSTHRPASAAGSPQDHTFPDYSHSVPGSPDARGYPGRWGRGRKRASVLSSTQSRTSMGSGVPLPPPPPPPPLPPPPARATDPGEVTESRILQHIRSNMSLVVGDPKLFEMDEEGTMTEDEYSLPGSARNGARADRDRAHYDRIAEALAHKLDSYPSFSTVTDTLQDDGDHFPPLPVPQSRYAPSRLKSIRAGRASGKPYSLTSPPSLSTLPVDSYSPTRRKLNLSSRWLQCVIVVLFLAAIGLVFVLVEELGHL